MIATLILAAVQAATPVPPAPPAAGKEDRTIVREIVIDEHAAGKSAAKDGKEQRREIMIIRSGDRADAASMEADKRIRIVDLQPGKDGQTREVRIIGGPGSRIAMVDCDPASRVDSESTDKDGKKTRVMVCAQGGNQVEALERASKRIAENKQLPDDVRSRVLAQMEAQIARLKSGK